MGKIHLFLTANSFHSNLLKKGWRDVDKAKGGIEIIGKSGISVSISYQGIDIGLQSWFKDIEKYQNMEHVSAPYSHALLPLIDNNDKWEIKMSVKGNVPIFYSSEFYTPVAKIPTEFFWILEGQTYLYSSYDIRCDIIPEKFSSKALGIKQGNKIGIIMRGFEDFLKLFFVFQRYPKNPQTLKKLLDEIESIGNMPDDVIVICPLDLEAPFVGSKFGEEIWQILFNGVKKRKLESVFTPIGKMLDKIREKSVETQAPHRDLIKWTRYDTQLQYLQKLWQIYPTSRRGQMLYSIASVSDILSAWERKIGGSKKEILLDAKNKIGADVKIPISYNQDIIDVQLAALDALTDNQTLLEKLERLDQNSLFIQRMKNFAEKNNL